MARRDGQVRCQNCSALNDMFVEQCVDCKQPVRGEGPRQCSAQIDGPKTHRWVVAWRRQCRNKTTHPSGRCHLHRLRRDREPTGI